MLLGNRWWTEDFPCKIPFSTKWNPYVFNRTRITSWTQGSVIIGQIPEKVVLSFKETNVVHGNYLLNFHDLKYLNINFFTLYVDGHQIPTKAFQPNFIGLQADYIIKSFMINLPHSKRKHQHVMSYTRIPLWNRVNIGWEYTQLEIEMECTLILLVGRQNTQISWGFLKNTPNAGFER